MAQTLTVWKFNTPEGAQQASETLQRLATTQVITVHDAATVSWEEGKKKPKTKQLTPTTASGALGGSFWGLLFGLIFFVPLLGAAIGAATGALAGSLTDVGIDEVKDAFAEHRPDDLIFTNLADDQEAALREVFQGE
jgi:uncharacterized membrane protein